MNEYHEQLLRQAAILHAQGRRLEAIAIFRQVLADQPGSSEGWYELGYLFKAEGLFDEALHAYGEALALGIRRPEEVHLNRAVIYSDHLRRDGEAQVELEAALAIAPSFVPALLNRGNLHEERGEREQAVGCYDQVLAGAGSKDDPFRDLRFEALARIAKLRPPESFEDPLIRRLQDAIAEPTGHVVRANLLFALGHILERLERFDLAFDAFAKANRWLLRQSGGAYQRANTTRLVDALIATFHSRGKDQLESPVADGSSPLFICGMFRSGSTLAEQVLAAHPKVTAGGEVDWLRQLATGRLAPFPDSMAIPDNARDAALADEYRAHLTKLFPVGLDQTYITDKRPDNFLLIGMIKRLFPDAKIVHSCRNPMDIGLSVFQQHLELRVTGYASDLGDIGHYYGEYRRLMAHWHSLYPGSIFDFDYDAFVREPRPALERLLDFLGLEWDDRCLRFHQLGNTVKTASYWQVRQPLSTRASGRWRNYAAQLGPLRRALQDAGVATEPF
ncbi:MAG: sulfotransferase [Pseudomonadota bacterium]|nr:sulfotransferase [Pseudomonadota bacterium]